MSLRVFVYAHTIVESGSLAPTDLTILLVFVNGGGGGCGWWPTRR
jgi:hypothetical protein